MHHSHKRIPVIGALLGGAVALALTVGMLVTAQGNPTPEAAPVEASPTTTSPAPCTEPIPDQLPYTSGVTLEGYTYCPSTHIDMQRFNAGEASGGLGGSWAHWLPDSHTLQVQRVDPPGCYNVPLSLTHTDQGSYTLTWQGSTDLDERVRPLGETEGCLLMGRAFSYDIVLPTDAPTPINLFEKAPLFYEMGPSLVAILP